MSNRNFSYEFRLEVVRRIEQGESISKLYHELGIRRSVLYRWWHIFRQEGAAGLSRQIGRPPGVSNATAAEPSVRTEEALREQIAELERKVGQQAVQLDFFKRAFRRVKESRQRIADAGATASTRRSGK